MAELHEYSLLGLREVVRTGQASREEVARAFLDRCAGCEGKVHAFLSIREGVVAEAAAADRAARSPADPRPLDGLPLAVKDNICTEGAPTSCGSRILEGYVPPYDATAWRRLRSAGALLLGKTNMDEFGMGSSTEYSAFGPTRNPWDRERVPGGSSGGSAAAVAAGLAPAALGSDTGGSVRQPAAFCGLVGLRPTYGGVSRHGLVAFASSMDQIGPMARTPADCALLLDAMAGPDPRDSTTREPPAPACGKGAASYLDQVRRDLEPFRFGVPREARGAGVEAGVGEILGAGCRVLEELGGEAVDISLPLTDHGIAVYYILAPAEASSNLARYDGVRYGLRRPGGSLDETTMKTRAEGFGQEVKRRIMLGTYALSAGYRNAYYLRASRVRGRIRGEYGEAFRKVGLIVTPTSPTTAFPLGERTRDPLAMYLSDAFTVPAGLAGLPALSLPCGLDEGGLPVGLQLAGPPFSEGFLLRTAHHFLQAHPFRARPPL